MRYVFIRAEKAQYPVALLCRVLRVARSGFYAWLSRDESARERRDRELLPLIQEIFKTSRKTYGSPRVFEDLQAQGVPCSRRTIERLMREAGITPPRKLKFKKTTDSDHPYATAANLMDRDFSSSAPNRVHRPCSRSSSCPANGDRNIPLPVPVNLRLRLRLPDWRARDKKKPAPRGRGAGHQVAFQAYRSPNTRSYR